LAAHCDGEAAFDCEFRLRAAPGGFVWLHERGQVVRGRNDRARQMFGVIRVVGDRRAAQNRLEQLANYDELTGHFNRTRLREAVDRIISSNQRKKTPAAFLTVGVDHMTVINDAFGHDAADTVLIEVGRRLDECLRVSDLVGRLGGDRFGIVLAHCPSGSVAVAAEKILAAIKGGPIPTSRGAVAATVSVGGASFPEHGLTSYDVITRAEAALAEAKRAGRDCYVHYRLPEGEREQRSAVSRSARRSEPRCAKAACYSPSSRCSRRSPPKSITTSVCCGFATADGEIVTAGAFVPVVEQLGLIR
jgi:diguanylate cyclase (GGDEF)-like protein